MITNAEAFTLSSAAFSDQDAMPILYTCDGKDISPALIWTNPPPATQSFALILADPDAPGGTWYHWVLYAIPKTIRELSEGIQLLPSRTIAGSNSWARTKYNGPCPPKGTKHRYIFTLYALDTPLTLPSRTDAIKLIAAMENHILETAELTAVYSH